MLQLMKVVFAQCIEVSYAVTIHQMYVISPQGRPTTTVHFWSGDSGGVSRQRKSAAREFSSADIVYIHYLLQKYKRSWLKPFFFFCFRKYKKEKETVGGYLF